ncbi:MAG: hypothetical protein ACK4N5_17110, partial [Myxococcales bacterium]
VGGSKGDQDVAQLAPLLGIPGASVGVFAAAGTRTAAQKLGMDERSAALTGRVVGATLVGGAAGTAVVLGAEGLSAAYGAVAGKEAEWEARKTLSQYDPTLTGSKTNKVIGRVADGIRSFF